MSGMSAVAHAGHGAAQAELRLVQRNSQKAVAFALAGDGVVPLGHPAAAVAALLLEAIALDEPGDPGAAERSGGHPIGSDESERVLSALNRRAQPP